VVFRGKMCGCYYQKAGISARLHGVTSQSILTLNVATLLLSLEPDTFFDGVKPHLI
jgi:hypothetical protein